MTLSTNEPNDQREVSELASYIRENRVAINNLSGGGNVGNTVLSVAGGTMSLTVGIDLGLFGFETVKINGLGISTLSAILGGIEGQVKVFVFQDTNVRLTDSILKANGTFYLNQLPIGSNFNPQQDDVIAFVNISGDGGSIGGYWKELYRTLSLK